MVLGIMLMRPGIRIMVMIGMHFMNDAESFEERVRGDGRPKSQQKQCNDASDKPHALEVNQTSDLCNLDLRLVFR